MSTWDERPYILVKAEFEGDKISSYVWGTNMVPDNHLYKKFSKHAIEFVERLVSDLGQGLELRLTLGEQNDKSNTSR